MTTTLKRWITCLVTLSLVLIMAVPTLANQPLAPTAITVTYSWENLGTILGSFGNLANPMNVTSGAGGTVLPHSGNAMLQVTEAPHDGTPQAYVAYIEGLAHGDVITASFYGWDDTPGASPSLRLWAHYAVSGDVNSYAGSPGVGSAYTSGIGWEQISYTYTFDSGGGTRDALVIEARLYSTPATDPDASTDYWIDDLQVEAPDTATITVPGIQEGELVINEIMSEPTDTEGENEWFEVKNITGRDIDILGCTLNSDGGIGHTITDTNGTTTVPAGAYFTFSRSGTIGDGSVAPDYVYGSGALNNASGTVDIRCGSLLVDQATYGSAGYAIQAAGASFAFAVPVPASGNPPHVDNDDPANWGISTSPIGSSGELGTPGAVNDDVMGANAVALSGLSATSPFAVLAMGLLAAAGLVVLRKRK